MGLKEELRIRASVEGIATMYNGYNTTLKTQMYYDVLISNRANTVFVFELIKQLDPSGYDELTCTIAKYSLKNIKTTNKENNNNRDTKTIQEKIEELRKKGR